MNTAHQIKYIECPRDAMQGWRRHIPTDEKAAYIGALLRVGFHTLDFGSFVSPKAIPQMADTKEVLQRLDLGGAATKLLAIVANERGAEEAAAFDQVSFLGFPFSVSETFQRRNTNSGMEESLGRVKRIGEICAASKKEPVVYLSMAFGNPYGDDYSESIVRNWAEKLVSVGVKILSLADTVGLATPSQVGSVTRAMIRHFPSVEVGVHLHSSQALWKEKLDAALGAGCTRVDGAMKGIGGCPMANDELVGNLDTERVAPYLAQKNLLQLDLAAFANASAMAQSIFH